MKHKSQGIPASLQLGALGGVGGDGGAHFECVRVSQLEGSGVL